MTVWILVLEDPSDSEPYSLYGVFTTKELAERERESISLERKVTGI